MKIKIVSNLIWTGQQLEINGKPLPMPHGSGLNCPYIIKEQGGDKFKFINYYTPMNEAGVELKPVKVSFVIQVINRSTVVLCKVFAWDRDSRNFFTDEVEASFESSDEFKLFIKEESWRD
jgi:hypothetical protein